MKSKQKTGLGRGFLEGIKRNGGIIIGLLIICAILGFMTDSFLTVRNFSNIMRQISVNVILACGMTMIIILGGIDLSVGSTIAIAGCLCCGLITNSGVPSYLAIVISIAAGTLVGVFNGLVVSRTTIPPFIVTLAMMNVGRGFARIYTKATTILVDDELFMFIGSGEVLGGIPIHFVYMVVVIIITALLLNRTKFGRNIYAVGDNKQAATYSGIDDKKVMLIAFIIMGFLASCAGIISSARTFSAQFNVGEGAEMDAISAVVLGGTSMTGGIGHLSGTIIGCIVIGVLNNGMNILGIDSSWQYVVKGVVVLIAVFIDYFKKRKE
ncbi:ABC transporter permease [Faecalicatena contorta]|uniref:Monosaccharide ABC transporter membrane protein, CUT2 family n=1 Tax=Faecalicatena contorta TaxID=39482 RepID=A0A316A2L9_9FIRM|nr:ABC transporter permease [Faecalicatena contorta]PWJ52101.1 monosaccharide ABC transporter membrane protein (CUT2 family) [Faecalicatena contorta]SUQ12379.1 monosaccharide ABC transporter membrane protein, CUT2 family [Faecalicatena contorta]